MSKPAGARTWARRHAPLVVWFSIGMLLLVLVLPSALNLPQSNPSTMAEYAPIPPDESTSSGKGNLSSLGLSSSKGLGSGAGTGEDGSTGGQGRGRKVSSKRCVGRPPRQTEDLMSPPCVPFFEGDNGGSTSQGVTRDEVRVVYYLGSEADNNTGKVWENTYFDLGRPVGPEGEPGRVRFLRRLASYFNERYQTYDRFIHFWAYLGAVSPTVEDSNAAAADNLARVKPFAALVFLQNGHETSYVYSMAERGVLMFGSKEGRDLDFFRRHAGRIWSFLPSIDLQAAQFSRLICSEIVNRPVAFGDPADVGKPRVYGLLHTDNSDFPGMIKFTNLVESKISDCGVNFRAKRSFHSVGWTYNTDEPDDEGIATRNMAEFKRLGVTTVIWTQGYNAATTRAAARVGYLPEWVVAGDGANDGNGPSVFQEQAAWSHAWVMTNRALEPTPRNSNCYMAMLEADPNSSADADTYCSLMQSAYEDLRQLFTGIQVAGPRLAAAAVEKGFRAIPRIASSQPSVQACFYDPGDYTCVKDAIVQWWDPTQKTPNPYPFQGCWRVPEKGKRFLESWPSVEMSSRAAANEDPCNGFWGSWFL